MRMSFCFVGVFAALFIAPALGLAESAQLPMLKPAVVEVNLSALPTSEKAALALIIRPARRMDALYMRQVWPATAALLRERTPPRDARARAAVEALNFFKGPWDERDGRIRRARLRWNVRANPTAR
jgi:hypothetical protein